MTSGRPGPTNRLFVAAVAALVALASIAVFWPATRGGFVWDDGGLITRRHEALDEWRDAVTAFGRPATDGKGVAYYRPIMIATFVADSRLTNGFEAVAFHRTNVLLHGLNAALVTVLLAVLGCSVWAAGIGGLAFGLHPLQTQAVALIFGRNDLLLVPPVVAMLVADAVVRPRAPRTAGALVALGFALTLWTKETGIISPIFLVLIDALWRRRPWREASVRPALFAALGVVTVLYFAARIAVIGSALETDYDYVAPLDRIPLAAAIFGYYFRYVVQPWGMAPAPYHAGMVDPARAELWIAVAVVVGFVLLTFWAYRRERRVAAGLLIFAVALLPVLGVAAAMKVLILDHRTYLPMLGIALAVGALADTFRGRVGRAAAIVAAGGLAVLTVQRVPHFADGLSLWSHAVEAAPSSDYARNNYAAALMDADRYHEAIVQLREALRLDPDYDRARFNLAGSLEYVGERVEAMREIELLAERRPDDLSVLLRLGLMRGRAGDGAGAVAALERAHAVAPDDRNVLRNLADALDRQRASDRAAVIRRRLVELEPTNAAAWTALGRSLAAAGTYAEAASAFERALAVTDSGHGRIELARVLWHVGRWGEASAQLQRARALGVDDPLLSQRLAEVGFGDAR